MGAGPVVVVVVVVDGGGGGAVAKRGAVEPSFFSITCTFFSLLENVCVLGFHAQ